MKETIDDIKQRVKKAQRNYVKNLDLVEYVLSQEKGLEVTRKPVNEHVVALCSGGLDSITMINYVIEQYNCIVHPLFIKRGAKAEKYEEEAFDFFMNFYKERHADKIGYGFKMSADIPPSAFKKDFPEVNALVIGHPLRNALMQNIAVNYAVALKGKYDIDAKTIFTAGVADDHNEPEIGLLSLRSQTLSTCVQMGDWEWQITSPFTDNYLTREKISKSDLIKYAVERQIPIEKTRTCFSAEELADGTCFACKKRIAAFNRVGMKDLIQYQNQPVNQLMESA